MSRRRKSIGRTNGLNAGPPSSETTSLNTDASDTCRLPLESSPRQTSMKKRAQTQRRLFPAVVSPPGNKANGYSQPGVPTTASTSSHNNSSPHSNGTYSLTASQEELSGIMDKVISIVCVVLIECCYTISWIARIIV